jgi:hypothetical protein
MKNSLIKTAAGVVFAAGVILPSPTPKIPRAVIPTRTPTPAAVIVPCGCSTDFYSCKDFANQETAQACFNWCASQIDTGLLLSDVHNLDSIEEQDFNLDGRVCEYLPKGKTHAR